VLLDTSGTVIDDQGLSQGSYSENMKIDNELKLCEFVQSELRKKFLDNFHKSG
jgi:hypothetical protein